MSLIEGGNAEEQDRLAIELNHATSVRSEQRLGSVILIVLGALVCFGVWAPLDAGAYADGFVVVSGERQDVQHPQGGVIKRLLVKDGDRVQKGQVLVELDNQAADSEERSIAAQVVGFEASQARLIAVRDGLSNVATPQTFLTLDGPEKAMADEALAGQRKLFASDIAALQAQHAVINQKKAEAAKEVDGYVTQAKSASEQHGIVDHELADLNQLYAQGYVPAPRLQELERTRSQLDGARGASEADAAKARETIGEAQMQGSSIDQTRRADAARQLREVEDRLASSLPQWQEAKKKQEDTRIRAPVDGVIVGLTANTEGGVVSAGQVIMQIVPSEKSLIIEARLPPDEVSEVYPGAAVELRFPAFKDRATPPLMGTVQQISADRLEDKKTDVPYFKLQVAASKEAIQLLHNIHGTSGVLRPGLRAQVVVKVKPRSAMSYLLEPLNNAMWKSFRER